MGLPLPSYNTFTGMLSSGRPIVATCRATTEIGHVVSQCGRVVEPGQVDSLAKAVLDLVDQPQACADLGLRARAYAEHSLAKDPILLRWSLKAAPQGSNLPVAAKGETL